MAAQQTDFRQKEETMDQVFDINRLRYCVPATDVRDKTY